MLNGEIFEKDRHMQSKIVESVSDTDIVAIINSLGSAISEATFTLILATGTLLAMISLRNGHVAERARNNVAESISLAMAKNDDVGVSDFLSIKRQRLESIKSQNVLFIDRYKNTSRAFMWTAIGFTLCPITYCLFKLSQKAAGPLQTICGIMGCVEIILIGVGLWKMRREFSAGPITLEENNKILEKLFYDDK
jgi:hypothetical protein